MFKFIYMDIRKTKILCKGKGLGIVDFKEADQKTVKL